VCSRTLVDWNRQSQAEIRTWRAVELEALQEKILATHEQELININGEVERGGFLAVKELSFV
jgi:hypothetical protein